MTQLHETSTNPAATAPAAAAGTALRSIAVLLTALSLSACSTTSAPTETNLPEARSAAVDTDAVLQAMLAPEHENSVALAIAGLPPAAEHTVRPVPNLHAPGVVDEVELLNYGDVNVEVYRPGRNASPLISAVELMSPAGEFGGVRIGMTASELRRQLGQEGTPHQHDLLFRLTPQTGAPYELAATFSGERVSKLRWAAYLD